MIEDWRDYLAHPFPVPTDNDRRRLEAAVGHRVPDAYWTLVINHQGCIPEPDRIRLPNGRRKRVGVLLHVLDRSAITDAVGTYGVLTAYANLRGLYPSEIVPFSDDTGGNKLAFDFRGTGPAGPGIVFVDHEQAGEAGLIPVARSFTDLIQRLEE